MFVKMHKIVCIPPQKEWFSFFETDADKNNGAEKCSAKEDRNKVVICCKQCRCISGPGRKNQPDLSLVAVRPLALSIHVTFSNCLRVAQLYWTALGAKERFLHGKRSRELPTKGAHVLLAKYLANTSRSVKLSQQLQERKVDLMPCWDSILRPSARQRIALTTRQSPTLTIRVCRVGTS
jgi:hypothetical protein